MKRIFTAILTICVAFAVFSNTAFAASNTYDLDDLGLQVTIPNGYLVFTRDISADDAILGDFGIAKSDLIDQFESGNVYLNAVSDTYSEEIVVTMTENDVVNFNLFSDTELELIASIVAEEYKSNDIKISECELYQHPQAKFVRLYVADTNETVHSLQYYTVYDNKAISFALRSSVGSLSSEQETVIQTIVDSVVFDEESPVPDQGEDTDPFLFTDENSGTKYTVPANWKQDMLAKDRETLDVRFISTKEAGCTIIYGSTDVWQQMSASEKAGNTRSGLNNSTFTETDIAELYNVAVDEVSTATYNGTQYFKVEYDYVSDTSGVDITVTMTQLFCMNNGWLYFFQFGGTSTNKLYSDFESLLNSVQYPAVSNMEADSADSADTPVNSTKAPESGTNSETNSNTSSEPSGKTNSNSGTIAVVSVLVIVALLAVAAFVPQKKCAAPEIDAPTCNTPESETANDAELTLLCKSCGHSLPLDSEYCHICGTKVEKGTLL